MSEHQLSRRAFIERGTLYLPGLLGAGSLARAAAEESAKKQAARPTPDLSIGIVTDIHHADKKPGGSRHYRDSLPKLRRAITQFHDSKAQFAISLGDFIDAAPTLDEELRNLREAEAVFRTFRGSRYYVLGNHCIDKLEKSEYLEHTAAKSAHHSFDHGEFHFVVLDACYRKDGVSYGRGRGPWNDADVPKAQRDWLRKDLARSKKPTVVFVHQRLDLPQGSAHGIHSAPTVRKILEDSKRVLAVFQGHHHVNDLREIGGVAYCTLPAIVEGPIAKNNAFASLELYADHSLRLRGFADTKSYPQLRGPAKRRKVRI